MLLKSLSQDEELSSTKMLSIIKVQLWLSLNPLFWLTAVSKSVTVLDLGNGSYSLLHQPVHESPRGRWSPLRYLILERGLHKRCKTAEMLPRFANPHEWFSTGDWSPDPVY